MNGLVAVARDWPRSLVRGWDAFWFTPAQPHTLALVRILAGAMLFYTHLVWSLDLLAFLGPNSWIDNQTARELQSGRYTWSWLWYIESPAVLWTLHMAGLVVFFLLTVGLWSRVMSVLACAITLAYCHRLHGAQFGLDQVNGMLAMYLMVGSCGAVYSVDRWLAVRCSRGMLLPPKPHVRTNVAIRLIQLHMCIVYLFGGISKMKGGEMWWDGSATWFALANLEYQSLDMTWLVYYPAFLSLLTHTTVFWETFYCFLVWPKFTRPVMLFLAVCVHGGIALFLGMQTFGLAMLIGNLAFVSPELVRALVGAAFSFGRGRAGEGTPDSSQDDDEAQPRPRLRERESGRPDRKKPRKDERDLRAVLGRLNA